MTRLLILRRPHRLFASAFSAVIPVAFFAALIATSAAPVRAKSSALPAAPSQPVDEPGGPATPIPPAGPGAPGQTHSGSVNVKDSLQARLEASPVLKAMEHELKRSMEGLRIKGGPRPYFISYLLWDVESHHMQASEGSCEYSDADRQHLLDVDLRVGNMNQDNTDFQGGIVFGPRLRLPLPIENDTNLLRLALWAATDAKYKVAVEQLAQKRAFLSNHRGSDSLPDFTKQKVLQKVQAEPQTPPDTAKTSALGRELSRYLAGFPWLLESRVGYQYYYTTFYYVDSEGARFVETVKEHTFLVALFTQAKDGSPLWDYLRIATRDPLALGEGSMSLAALKDSLAPILKRLDYLRSAPPLANYRGPVLFTGTAAGELLNKALLTPEAHLREPLGAQSEPSFMLSLAGRKFLPSEITVIDTPSMRAWQGRSLFGHYELDHQGQPAQDITLIKDGRVQDFFTGKVPLLKPKGHLSNGHWRYGGGFPGVTVLRSSKPVSEADLRNKLAQMGEDEGTGYGLIVSKVVDDDAFKLLRHPLSGHFTATDGLDGRGAFTMTMPCELDMLDARTGKVTPVRGLSFPSLDSKSLRDIAAVGDQPHLHEPQASFSILCPSLLFSLLDLKGSRATQPLPPLIP